MYQDVTVYVTNCHWCHVANGHYKGLHTQQGLLVANNPMDLLCMDSIKVDPSKDCKKFASTDWCFIKFNQAFVITNQKALIISKILVNKWFYVCGIPAHIHSDKAEVLKMTSCPTCTPPITSSSLWPHLTICVGILSVQGSAVHCYISSRLFQKNRRQNCLCRYHH